MKKALRETQTARSL